MTLPESFSSNPQQVQQVIRAIEAAHLSTLRACTHKSRSVMDRVDVRFTPNATELLRGSEMTRCARSRPEQVQQHSVQKLGLLDHLVGGD